MFIRRKLKNAATENMFIEEIIKRMKCANEESPPSLLVREIS